MNKSYLLVICLFLTAFTGCIEIEDAELEKTTTDETAAIYGCMDTAANNYDDKATEDDGTCDYEDCLQITGQYLSDNEAMDFLGSQYDTEKNMCILSLNIVDIDEDRMLFVNEDGTKYVFSHEISGTSSNFTLTLLNRTLEIVKRDAVIQGNISSDGNITTKYVESSGIIKETNLWVPCNDNCFEKAFENLCIIRGDNLGEGCDFVVGINIPEEECELVPYGHCSGEDLNGRDLSELNLTGIDLSYANLSGIEIYQADLTDADLSYANLSGANLTGANLTGANLTGANLTGANLYQANLHYADFTDAIVTNADFTDTQWYQTIWIDGEMYDENQA